MDVVFETDLHLEPNEASDLCLLEAPQLLERRGWDRAFLTVLDEAHAEESLALLGHQAGAEVGEGWHAERVPAKPSSGAGKTEDAEACARRDGFVYALGSQFGSKAGPLDAGRSWIARVAEDALGGDDKPELEIARLRFGLHRAINDAIARSGVELIERGPTTTDRYIDATIARGAAKSKRWAGRVSAADHPINVEGAEFRANGRLVLGLRYPVSAAGHPLLVEVEGVEGLFADPDAVPRCSNVWELEVGGVDAPMGVRALNTEGDDRFDAIVGDLDAAGKGATILADHPEGGRAASLHVRFSLPLVAGGGAVAVERRHDFGSVKRVEGIALGPDGHTHYVIDEEGHVALRTLLLD